MKDPIIYTPKTVAELAAAVEACGETYDEHAFVLRRLAARYRSGADELNPPAGEFDAVASAVADSQMLVGIALDAAAAMLERLARDPTEGRFELVPAKL